MKTLEEVRQEYRMSLPEGTKDIKNKTRLNGAKIFLRQYVNEFDGDVKEALTIVTGSAARNGFIKRPSGKQQVIDDLKDQGSITALDIFKKYNKGPSEMKAVIKFGVRNFAPEERVWIDLMDDSYIILNIGPEVPEGWKGPLPT